VCAGYGSTLTIARTSRGDVFGGYSSRPFGVTECCLTPGNECVGSEAITYCYDSTATSSFVFSLVGAGREPTRYTATGSDTHYVYVNYDTWPAFGASEGGDLSIGMGGAPGIGGSCSHATGSTYTVGADPMNGVCGAPGDWGATDVEVWHVEDEYLADHYSNEDGGAAIEGEAGHIHHTDPVANACLDGCCASAPCQNGGICEESVALDTAINGHLNDVVRSYVCHCSPGFDGNECDHVVHGKGRR
jgi:hypothetical protein